MTASFNLELVLGELGKASNRTATAIERAINAPPAQPVFSQREAADSVNAGGSDLVLALGGPTQGRLWHLRTLVVGGLTYATVAAGTALLVRSAMRPTNAATLGLSAVLDQATSLPLPAGYSRGQMVIRNPEKFYVIIVGGTASQAYVAAGSIEEFQEGVREAVADL